MKQFGSKVLLSKLELEQMNIEYLNKHVDDSVEDAEHRLEKRYKKYNRELEQKYEAKEAELEKLLDTKEDTIKNQKKTIKNLTADKEELNAVVYVLEADRDKVRDVVKQRMENDDLEAVLVTTKERLDAREAKLKDREAKADSKDESRYKEGYADGVADGVRKVSEITAKDRENAMKIAMVAASSHTPVANMKEVMDASRQLTAGTEDSEVK